MTFAENKNTLLYIKRDSISLCSIVIVSMEARKGRNRRTRTFDVFRLQIRSGQQKHLQNDAERSCRRTRSCFSFFGSSARCCYSKPLHSLSSCIVARSHPPLLLSITWLTAKYVCSPRRCPAALHAHLTVKLKHCVSTCIVDVFSWYRKFRFNVRFCVFCCECKR